MSTLQTHSHSLEFPPTETAVGSAGWVRRTDYPTSLDLPVSHLRGVQGWEWAEDGLQGEIQEGRNAFSCSVSGGEHFSCFKISERCCVTWVPLPGMSDGVSSWWKFSSLQEFVSSLHPAS